MAVTIAGQSGRRGRCSTRPAIDFPVQGVRWPTLDPPDRKRHHPAAAIAATAIHPKPFNGHGMVKKTKGQVLFRHTGKAVGLTRFE